MKEKTLQCANESGEGGRAAVVVFIANRTTLALTLFFYYCYSYTLNRVSYFCFILSIGILVY